MKAARFKAAPAPNPAGMSAADRITRAQLVVLIASRLPSYKRLDGASAHARAGQRINYAVSTGKLIPAASGGFAWGAVADWTRRKWPGRFDDLPQAHRLVTVGLSARAGRVTSKARAIALPVDVAECHAALARMDDRNAELARAVDMLRARLAEARPLAVKAERLDSWNRNKGRKPKR